MLTEIRTFSSPTFQKKPLSSSTEIEGNGFERIYDALKFMVYIWLVKLAVALQIYWYLWAKFLILVHTLIVCNPLDICWDHQDTFKKISLEAVSCEVSLLWIAIKLFLFYGCRCLVSWNLLISYLTCGSGLKDCAFEDIVLPDEVLLLYSRYLSNQRQLFLD